jgi:hypothetical protein
MRAPVSSRPTTGLSITVPWPVGCGSQALMRPSLENRLWQTPAPPPRWPPFYPSTLPFISFPTSEERSSSADAPAKTLLKRLRLH